MPIKLLAKHEYCPSIDLSFAFKRNIENPLKLLKLFKTSLLFFFQVISGTGEPIALNFSLFIYNNKFIKLPAVKF